MNRPASGHEPPETPGSGFTEGDYPSVFLAASRMSLRGQDHFVRLSQFELWTLVVAAAIGASLPFLGPAGTRVAATAVAGMLVLAALVRSVSRSNRPDVKWFEGRAIAESVKTLAWKYMTHAEPFDVTTSQSDEVFFESLAQVLGDRGVLDPSEDPSILHHEQITAAMRRVRRLRFDQRRAIYINGRLRDQYRWYSKRARDHQRSSDRWFVMGICCEGLAVASAVSIAAYPQVINLIGFFSTLTAASITLSRLRADTEVSQRYALAAQELALIQPRLEKASEATFPVRVVEAEAAISREHKLWGAKHVR